MSDVREYAEAGPPEHPEKEGRKPAEAAGGEAAAGAGRGAPEGSPLSPQTAPIPELPDFTRWGGTERIAMRSVRKATARRMTQAWSQIPHAWHYDNADVTEIERIRQDQKSEIDEGSLSMTVYAMKAVTAALGEHPRVNSSIDVETEEIILKQYYHIGVAVDTERGLIVPVIRDVDKKSVADLSAEFADTVKRTRSGEASLEELQGGTFTITNVGPLGGVSISPIVNFPQVAVLGMAAATWRPVVVEQNGERTVTPRLMLPLVLAYDHRVVDGADAARFVSKTVEMLEDPEKLMLAM
jgi:pyruvate dehydrogenase E2 component (dihydrolipoamide acetyltransferase)